VYFKYGAYQHEDNSVTMMNSSIRMMRSPRGRRAFSKVEFRCAGEVIVDPTLTTNTARQADLTTKMFEIEAAYSDDYKDAGFYQDDGTVTTHFIETNNANNMTGNVVDFFNWTPGTENEYCTIRSFQFGISAMFRDTYSGIFDYRDQITRIGNAGPVYQWRLSPTGLATARQYSAYSTQHHVHSGRAIGIYDYPLPPSPLASGTNYLGHLTKVQNIAPMKYGGPFKYAMYTTTWEYHYVYPANVINLPVLI
jgi:hypothetical protein